MVAAKAQRRDDWQELANAATQAATDAPLEIVPECILPSQWRPDAPLSSMDRLCVAVMWQAFFDLHVLDKPRRRNPVHHGDETPEQVRLHARQFFAVPYCADGVRVRRLDFEWICEHFGWNPTAIRAALHVRPRPAGQRRPRGWGRLGKAGLERVT